MSRGKAVPPEMREALKLLDKFTYVRGSDELLYAVRGSQSFSLAGDGQRLRRWLAGQVSKKLKKQGRAPSTYVLKDVVELAIAQAEQGEAWRVCRRLAPCEDGFYLSLGLEQRTVKVTAEGWEVLKDPPPGVLFRCDQRDRPLPVPHRGGTLKPLFGLLRRCFPGLPEETVILIIAWLVGCLLPEPEHPILALYGAQGSGKTTLARFLRGLLDPAGASGEELDTLPATERDWFALAANRYVVAFDNVSAVPRWFSDALARIATGDRLSQRKLYADADLVTVSGSRPVILNGIPESLVSGDVVDRAIVIELPQVEDKRRRPAEQLWDLSPQFRARALGGLCTAAATALQNRGNVDLIETPRMASFAQWVVAAETALPWDAGRFVAVYQGNRRDALNTVLEASVVAATLTEWLEEQRRQEISVSPTELLEALTGKAGTMSRSDSWPAAPDKLTIELKRIVPAFEQVYGWHLSQHRGAQGVRSWRMVKVCDAEQSEEAPVSQLPAAQNASAQDSEAAASD